MTTNKGGNQRGRTRANEGGRGPTREDEGRARANGGGR